MYSIPFSTHKNKWNEVKRKENDTVFNAYRRTASYSRSQRYKCYFSSISYICVNQWFWAEYSKYAQMMSWTEILQRCLVHISILLHFANRFFVLNIQYDAQEENQSMYWLNWCYVYTHTQHSTVRNDKEYISLLFWYKSKPINTDLLECVK